MNLITQSQKTIVEFNALREHLGSSTKAVFTLNQINRAKRRYWKEHPECAVTGLTHSTRFRRKTEVHHQKPVHLYPHLACDPRYFITLIPELHFVVGHFGNWKDFNPNVLETARAMRQEMLMRSVSFKALVRDGKLTEIVRELYGI